MKINLKNLGAKLKDTDTVLAISFIDFDKKLVSVYSFGDIVEYPLDEIDFVLI